MNVSNTKSYNALPNYSSFSLNISSRCIPLGAATLDCNDNFNSTLTNIQLIKGSYISLGGCNGGVSISSFKPNVSITASGTTVIFDDSNVNPNITPISEVCSGVQFSLVASPGGFPEEAYHWQFSTDNSKWVDFPNKLGSIFTNDVRVTKVSIADLLPTTHTNFYNKPIYFRLGYDQNRPFTNAISITYSSCAPIVSAPIEYKPPKCSGNEIEEIKITFDRDLETGEVLNLMSLYDYDNISLLFSPQFNNVTYTNKTYFFPVSGLKLISGKKYYVGFSANKNGVETGLINNAKTYFFTYTDPPALIFTPPTAISPLCNNGTGGLTTTVTGGTPKSTGLRYNYYIDNATTPITAGVTEVLNQNGSTTATITGLSAASHTIIVTDANDCFEK